LMPMLVLSDGLLRDRANSFRVTGLGVVLSGRSFA